MLDKKITEKIDEEFDSLIEDLKEIISVKSVSKRENSAKPFGKGCADVLDLFLKKAKNYGFVTKNIDNYAGTVSFNSEDPALGILCHLDTVEAEKADGWKSDPFEPEVRDNRLYGRGAIDDKGPAVAVLYAMKIIKDLGIKLKSNVRFIVGCDEENGSSDMQYYRKKENFPPMCFTPDGDYPCINFEKGMIRARFKARLTESNVVSIMGGKVINAVPSHASIKFKDIAEVNVLGKPAHASTPQLGENALTKLVKKICESGISKDRVWKSLSQIFPHGETNGKSLGIASFEKKTGGVTAVWSRAEIKDSCLFGEIDIRFPSSTTLETVIKNLENTFKSHDFEVEILMKENYHLVDENSELVSKLLKVYSEETGKPAKAKAIGGGTYVHDIDGGVAFGAEFPGENNNMHGVDESVDLDSLKLNLKLFIGAILELCG